MTTDQAYPGLHYFVVDVETSALRPDEGELLSIGAIVMDERGNLVDDLYIRIQGFLEPAWYKEELPAVSDTNEWWRLQNEYARNEAYLDTTLTRVSLMRAAHQFRNWVLQYGDDWTDRIFVADPVQFDFGWIMDMFQECEVTNPFWYHTIDLFSLMQGQHAAGRRGGKKGMLDMANRVGTTKPLVPHHPLADAFASAQDFAQFLPEDLIELDHPHLDGLEEWQADNEAEVLEDEAVSEDLTEDVDDPQEEEVQSEDEEVPAEAGD